MRADGVYTNVPGSGLRASLATKSLPLISPTFKSIFHTHTFGDRLNSMHRHNDDRQTTAKGLFGSVSNKTGQDLSHRWARASWEKLASTIIPDAPCLPGLAKLRESAGAQFIIHRTALHQFNINGRVLKVKFTGRTCFRAVKNGLIGERRCRKCLPPCRLIPLSHHFTLACRHRSVHPTA